MKYLLLASMLAAAPFPANAQDVSVLALTCTLTSVGPKVEGEIKNLTSQPLSYVSIIFTFLDANGNFVSVSHALPDFNPILPGQTSTFAKYGDMNPAITKVTIASATLEGPALTASGISSAPCRPSSEHPPNGING